MSSNKPTMLEVALEYARQGLEVLPLCCPSEDGKRGCGLIVDTKGKLDMYRRQHYDNRPYRQVVHHDR